MLRSAQELQGYSILAADGQIGHVYEFYFDDQLWVVRYLVVDTGKWLPGRKVLLLPTDFGQPDLGSQQFPVKLTREQVKNSPNAASQPPVSRQAAESWQPPVGPPLDRLGGGLFDGGTIGMQPEALLETLRAQEGAGRRPKGGPARDHHLRSSREVIGYSVEGSDGNLGFIEDFILGDNTWTIHYLVVNTQEAELDKRVVVPPRWIRAINWAGSQVYLNLDRGTVKDYSEYNGPVIQ